LEERIESEDPYFVSLRLDLEYALKKKGIKSKVFELQTFEKNEEILMNFIISSAIVVIGEIKRSQLDFLKSLNDKRLTVKIPAGTQHGDALRVRGEGVPAASGRTGDLYLKVIIKIPMRMSSSGRKLLSEFSAMEGENTSPDIVPLSKL